MKSIEPIRIFVHVPKCGGTTINHALSSGLSEGEMLPLHYSRLGRVKREGSKLFTRHDADNYVGSLSAHEKSKIRLIAGHLAYYGIHRFFDRPVQYILFMRDPLKRAVSHYRFLLKRLEQGGFLTEAQKAGLLDGRGTADFNLWLQNNPAYHNYMTRFFFDIPEQSPVEVNADSVKRIKLDHQSSWVGLTETLDWDLAYLTWRWPGAGRLVRRNTSGSSEKIQISGPDELRQKFFSLDEELYQWARGRRCAFISSHWEYFPKACLKRFFAGKNSFPKQ